MTKQQLAEYARQGMLRRIDELSGEIRMLQAHMPGVVVAVIKAPSKRTRKPMTAAQRQAVSVRMKRYWRGRKKEAGK